MILDVPTRKLQIVLTAAKTANNMPVLVDWLDTSSQSVVSGLTSSITNGTTTVDILPAPAAMTRREVKAVSIYNKDTAVKTIKVLYNDNGTAFEIVRVTLQIDDTLGYSIDDGWYVQDLNGARKTVPSLSDIQLASLIHAAVSKTTPVGADEIPMWDSVTGLLNRLTFTNALNWFAATLGNASNVFSVAAATAAAHAVRADQLKSGLTSITAAIATPTTGKITFTLAPCVLDFRNSAVANGAPNTRFIPTTLTLATDNNGASFGATTAVQARLILLAIDSGAGIVLGVTNLSGGISLTEEGVLTSTTAIAGAVTGAANVYTTSALGAGLYPYRVVGAVDATWTTGSGWITALAAVINAGGNALSGMSGIGYGQVWTDVKTTPGRVADGTVYRNLTGRPIEVAVNVANSGSSGSFGIGLTVGGVTIDQYGTASVGAGNMSAGIVAIVPPGASYSAAMVAATLAKWAELR